MANRYWVGNSGTWDLSSTTHWASSSGGASGASVPTSSDNVFFDANSFTASGQTVTVPLVAGSYVLCNNMDWTGALYSPTIDDTSGCNFGIYGSLTFIPSLKFLGANNVLFEFRSTSIGNTVNFAGVDLTPTIIGQNAEVLFIGIAGGWTLQGDIIGNPLIEFTITTAGSFDTNGKRINCLSFDAYYDNLSITLGSSIITCTYDKDYGDGGWFQVGGSSTSINAGTSTVILAGVADIHYAGFIDIGNSLSVYDVHITATNTSASSPFSFYESGTYHNVTLDAGLYVLFQNSVTQTINNIFTANGTASNKITMVSDSAGLPFYISKSSGLVSCIYLSLQDSHAIGSATFTATNSLDVSGNSGWIFASSGTPGNVAARDENGRPSIICASSLNGTTIVPIKSSPLNHGLMVDDEATGSDNGNNGGNAMIDENGVSVWTALSSADNSTIIEIYGDVTKGEVLIDSN